MIVTITTFRLPRPMSRDEAREVFRSTAPKYREVPGLVSKHYILAEDGSTAGGVYLWRTRAAAEAMYTEQWREFVRGKYGTEPIVTWYDNPVVVDNIAGQIRTDD